MSFELRGHTADVGVAARGSTLGETFAALADGMAATMVESVPEGGDRFAFEETAESREALLFDYLDRLIYERDVRLVMPVDNEAVVTPPDDGDDGEGVDSGKWHVEGTARGVALAGLGAREVKAVTYSEMRLEPTDDGWEGYVVLDM